MAALIWLASMWLSLMWSFVVTSIHDLAASIHFTGVAWFLLLVCSLLCHSLVLEFKVQVIIKHTDLNVVDESVVEYGFLGWILWALCWAGLVWAAGR